MKHRNTQICSSVFSKKQNLKHILLTYLSSFQTHHISDRHLKNLSHYQILHILSYLRLLNQTIKHSVLMIEL